MTWLKAFRNLGVGLLVFFVVVGAAVIGLTIERTTRGPDQALAQEMVIHHFERSSWFALNAGKYEVLDPDLAQRFRESATWHARRAREFQRMNTAYVPGETERDAEHDRSDCRLMERALSLDSVINATDKPTGSN